MNTRPSLRQRLSRVHPWLGRPRARRGQTLVEVGLILPIFVLSLIAILEFGWWAAVNSAIHTASREGSRYGSSVDDPAGATPPNYANCAAILNHAYELAGPLVDLTGDVTVSYERETATPGQYTTVATCPTVSAATIQRWDRVVVTVTYSHDALTPIMDALIGDQTLVSIDRRSIVKQ